MNGLRRYTFLKVSENRGKMPSTPLLIKTSDPIKLISKEADFFPNLNYCSRN